MCTLAICGTATVVVMVVVGVAAVAWFVQRLNSSAPKWANAHGKRTRTQPQQLQHSTVDTQHSTHTTLSLADDSREATAHGTHTHTHRTDGRTSNEYHKKKTARSHAQSSTVDLCPKPINNRSIINSIFHIPHKNYGFICCAAQQWSSSAHTRALAHTHSRARAWRCARHDIILLAGGRTGTGRGAREHARTFSLGLSDILAAYTREYYA